MYFFTPDNSIAYEERDLLSIAIITSKDLTIPDLRYLAKDYAIEVTNSKGKFMYILSDSAVNDSGPQNYIRYDNIYSR